MTDLPALLDLAIDRVELPDNSYCSRSQLHVGMSLGTGNSLVNNAVPAVPVQSQGVTGLAHLRTKRMKSLGMTENHHQTSPLFHKQREQREQDIFYKKYQLIECSQSSESERELSGNNGNKAVKRAPLVTLYLVERCLAIQVETVMPKFTCIECGEPIDEYGLCRNPRWSNITFAPPE